MSLAACVRVKFGISAEMHKSSNKKADRLWEIVLAPTYLHKTKLLHFFAMNLRTAPPSPQPTPPSSIHRLWWSASFYCYHPLSSPHSPSLHLPLAIEVAAYTRRKCHPPYQQRHLLLMCHLTCPALHQRGLRISWVHARYYQLLFAILHDHLIFFYNVYYYYIIDYATNNDACEGSKEEFRLLLQCVRF